MDPHAHCNGCFKLKCSFEPCPLIECEQNGCKSRMHQCKLDDHRSICLRQRVPCINNEFGCALRLYRNDLKTHLAKCPASVVSCSFEYNRWPAHSREKPLNSFNDRFNYKQHLLDDLDSSLSVALAYRDQEMLNDLDKFKRIKRLFRNNLTRKYPAVPMSPYLCATKTLQSEPNDQALVRSNSLTKCSSFVSTASQTASTITISDEDSDSSTLQMHRNPPGLRKSIMDKLTSTNVLSNVMENKELLVEERKALDEPTTSTAQPSGASPCTGQSMRGHSSCSQHHLSTSSNSSSEDESVLPVCKLKKPKRPRTSKEPGKLDHLIVDLDLEFLANHQIKPKRMYSFRCGADFRRDEYCLHYQNVHSDIMGGLNGWMERRCPLYQYNCKFFVRRLHPVFANKKSKIIFSQLSKSFGHCPVDGQDDLSANQSANQEINLQENPQTSLTELDQNGKQEDDYCRPFSLTDLPPELISKIIGYLDAFSMNNLSLTNKLLRTLVSSRLEQRGLVSLIWKKVRSQNSTGAISSSWTVIGYQWKFSNLFDEIKQWRFDNDHKLLNHIKNCSHFDRMIRKEPYKLIGLVKE